MQLLLVVGCSTRALVYLSLSFVLEFRQVVWIKAHQLTLLRLDLNGCGPIDIHSLILNCLLHFPHLFRILHLRLHSLLHTHHRVLGPHSELIQLFELVVGADGQAEHVQLDHLVLFKELIECKINRLKKDRIAE